MIKSVFCSVFIFVLAALAPICGAQSDTLPDAIIYAGPKAGHILVVDKSEQLLYLYKNDDQGQVTLEKILACSTGKVHGDKMVEGDKKTPEGFYVFNQKMLPRELAPIYGILAYPMDYPNFWDKHLGRGGHGIWMHGIDKPLKNYDSNGCVELQNREIAALEELIELYDTPIIVYEQLSQAPARQLLEEASGILKFLESWAHSWATKDHGTYRSLYAPDFVNSDGLDLDGWMANKENAAKQQNDIKLSFGELKIYRHRDVIVANFIQHYGADGQEISTGLKRLYLKKNESGAYQIVAEEYSDMPQKATDKWLTAADRQKFLGDGAPVTLASLDAPPREAETQSPGDDDKTPEDQSDGQATGEVSESQGEGSESQTETADGTGGQASAIVGKLNLGDEVPPPPADETGERPEDPLVAESLEKAEEAALVREEARVNLEAERAKNETLVVKGPDKPQLTRRDEPPRRENPETEAELRALAAARDKLSGQADPALKESLIAEVEAWAKAWNERDTDKYFSFYHPDFFFEDKKLDLPAFIAYRGALIKEAGILSVELSHFSVKVEGDDLARVMFRQKYRSDQVRDVGRKTLFLKKTDAGWKITAETWQSF